MRTEYTLPAIECDKIWPENYPPKEPEMMKAEKTTVNWDPAKKEWHVRIQIGEEVIKRALSKTPQDASEDVLRSKAVETAKDEGYEVDAAQVAIQR
jgi:hypothetical protein